ncbi:MAG: TIGR02281 family clan AA aspartic protease [Rhizobacter sp.]
MLATTQAGLALAQKGASVALSGVMGTKALLVVNGAPKTLGVGDVHAGVKLVSVSAQDALVEVDGKRVQLSLGGTHVNLGGNSSEGSGSRIVLTAGSGGHFVTRGSINGRSVRFMVDTGATTVAMSQAEAERIGVKYTDGQVGAANTANGQVMMYLIKLDSVRINDVQVFNVDAAVLLAPMDMVLLGNSFLTRFQMKRENNVLTLDKKS